MEPFFDRTQSHYVAAGLYLAVAGLLGLAWAIMAQRRWHFGWPMFVGGLVGLGMWQFTALALLADGATEAGLVLSGIIAATLIAATGTFLINKHPWIIVVAFACLGAGALLFPGEQFAFWVAAGLAVVLAILCVIVIVSGKWWPITGYGAAAGCLLAIGAATALGVSAGACIVWRNMFSVRAGQPIWLLVLLLIPITVWWSFRGLAGLGPVRRWIALGLRCTLILLLGLALSEVYLLRSSEITTVLFLWDRSLSIPMDDDPNEPGDIKDLIAKRHLGFINDAVAQRGPKRQRDSAGLIVFGRYPRLELPPANVPHFRLKRISSTVDETYTDISAAIKLALACFPEGTAKRIVLISDGNENIGQSEDQARIAKQNGVEIDTVLVSSGVRNEQEIVVERIDVPAITQAEARLPIRIIVRSYNPRTVVGRLLLTKTSLKVPGSKENFGEAQVTFHRSEVDEQIVRVRPGLNAFYVQQPGLEAVESCIYEARFIPIGVERTPITLDDAGIARLDQEAVKLDRPKNNYASASVLARGDKKLLFIEPVAGDHDQLLKTLGRATSSLKIAAITPAQLPQDVDTLNFLLGGFDGIVLANVPRDSFTPEQDAAFRTAVHEQGCGLIMLGGRSSYGAGGWQNTEVEKALPVTCDLTSFKVEGRSGLALIMHASEIAEGNMWQKTIAKLAINRLGPMDMMGVLYYGDKGHAWHIPFQTVGGNKGKMLALLDTMNPGDMPDAQPTLKMAHDALVDPKHNLGTKHIIFISDGDHWQPPIALLQQIKAAKITLTTVCVTSHGQGEYKNMLDTALITGGRSYPMPNRDGTFTPLDPRQLPEIYIKETRLISQAFIHEKAFQPNLMLRSGPTDGLPEALPDLYGFVRTSPRANPLVQLPIMSPRLGEMPWPIVAHWQYGLGKAVAYTSDALTTSKGTFWDRDWANSEMYAQFWNQLVAWTMRELDDGKNLQMTTEWRDGKVLIVVNARDENRKPLGDLDIVVRVTSPTPFGDVGRPDVKLEQKNIGRYEAEIRAEDVGSYFLTAMAYRQKQVKGAEGKLESVREPAGMLRSAVTVPYSPEFSEMESNPAVLERLSTLTDGKVFKDDKEVLANIARDGEVFRPSPAQTKSLQSIWHWLLVLAGLGLFFDVAVRRIAIEPSAAAAAVQSRWEQLRGTQPAVVKSQQFLDRLKGRKEQVDHTIEKEKATRRYQGTEKPAEAPPIVGTAPAVESKPKPKPGPTSSEPEPQDYASRLLRAKRKAMEERDKDLPPDKPGE